MHDLMTVVGHFSTLASSRWVKRVLQGQTKKWRYAGMFSLKLGAHTGSKRSGICKIQSRIANGIGTEENQPCADKQRWHRRESFLSMIKADRTRSITTWAMTSATSDLLATGATKGRLHRQFGRRAKVDTWNMSFEESGAYSTMTAWCRGNV